MAIMERGLALAAAAAVAACATAPAGTEPAGRAVSGAAQQQAAAARQRPAHDDWSRQQQAFWDGLLRLCGQAFEGAALVVPEADTDFAGRRLVMHVRECADAEIRIPFHVGDDRSRTWVLRRTPAGIELKHIHRHEDGTASANTDYGGLTRLAGTPHRQEFPADAFSVAAVAARATQWWFLELYPGHVFAYGLFREATGLRYRMEFDLARPVAPPPPPWD
jgi:hypothetical protein